VCWKASASCPDGTVQDQGTCGGVCCTQTSGFCGTWGFEFGHCIDSTAKCAPNETRFDFFINGVNCSTGQTCCAVENSP
jgi:hypothetical protein